MAAAVGFLFFLSGAAALLFETLWFRLATLLFGSSLWASSLVLASFMAGLAIGSALVGRRGNQIRSPIRWYAVLEVAGAVLGLGLVLLFPVLPSLLAPLFQALLDQPAVLHLVRLVIGTILLILPAAAMGATLPILVKGLCRGSETFGGALGMLYGLNTLGAVVGALAGEFVLIEHLGIRGTALVAALVDLAAAAGALWVARSLTPGPIAAKQERAPAAPAMSWSARRLLLAAALAGAILLALEVVWFRVLLLRGTGTSRVFASMLAVVLASMAVGSAMASLWLRWRPSSQRIIATVALLGGVSIIGCYGLYASSLFASNLADYTHSPGAMLTRAALLMGVVSMLSGMLFPLIGQMIHTELESDTKSAGYLVSSNTIGAICGAVLGGFLLVPALGMELSLFMLALAYGGVALLVWPPSPLGSSVKAIGLYAAVGGLVVAAALFPFGWMQDRLFQQVIDRHAEAGFSTSVRATREGPNETIHYLQYEQFGQPHHHRLVTNGHSMSGTRYSSARYMSHFVYLPVALHPAPKSALLISYGVGITAKSLTDTASFETIDVVDISRDVLDLAAVVYPDPDTHPLRDPRVDVIVEDGRFWAQTTDRTYDLITGEPPPPKLAGVGNLYSQEYFELLYDRLNPGGMVTYWLPTQEMLESDFRAIVAGFCNAFEGECSLWQGAGMDWLLLGIRDGGQRVTEEQFVRQWSDPVVAPSLRRLGFEFPEDLAATFLADSQMLAEMTRSTEPLVDDYPYRLSPHFPDRPLQSMVELLPPNPDRFGASQQIAKHLPDAIVKRSTGFFQHRYLFHNHLSGYKMPPAHPRLRRLHHVLTETSYRSLVFWLLDVEPDDITVLDRLRDTPEGARHYSFLSGIGALADRRYADAVPHFEAAGARPHRLYALCLAGLDDEATELAAQFESQRPLPPEWRPLFSAACRSAP
jgi:predicted membrane-bound spermidine synthase